MPVATRPTDPDCKFVYPDPGCTTALLAVNVVAMNTRKLVSDGIERVLHRLSVWWNDAQFFWSTRNKTALYAVTGIAGVIGLSVVSLNIYFETKQEKRQLHCLALNVYHESRGEPVEGQYAVAEVTMNRVASRHYPDTICGVVYQQNWDVRRQRYVGMFSWTELDEKPLVHSRLWKKSLEIARSVYNHEHQSRVDGALFYHATHIRPRWSRTKTPKVTIGNHVFY